MIEAYYNLKRVPFAKDIDPGDIYPGDSISEFCQRLEYMKEKRGILLATGEPGIGKTLAVRCFVLKGYRFSGFVKPSSVRCGKFYKWVTNILGCEPDDELSTDDIVGKGCKIHLSKQKDFYSVTDVMRDEN